MRFFSVFTLVLAAMIWGSTVAWADVALVRDGTPLARIVVPAGAVAEESLAAERMQHYISRMTGATLPIVSDGDVADDEGVARLFVGRTQQAAGVLDELKNRKAPREASLVVADGNDVFVVGVDPIGTLHATYFLLEEFGCRWYIPKEWGIVVPTHSELIVKQQSTYRTPSLVLRGGLPVVSATIDEDADWLIHEWARGNHLGGDRLWGWGHSYRFLIPKENFAEHPEWFALVNGERHAEQLCITHPEGRAFALATVRKALEEFGDHPPEGIWISPDDTTANLFCQCEGCQAYVQDLPDGTKNFAEGHDRIIAYANFFAEALKDDYPNARVTYMVDYHSQGFPSIVKPASNSGFWVIHWMGDQFHGQNDSTGNGKALTRWSVFRLPMTVYTYWGSHTSWSFWPVVHAIGNDIRYYKSKGVTGVYSEIHESWGAQHLNFIVFPRVMWDTNTDVKAWVDDFCNRFYGPAAAPMREYYRLLEKAAVDGGPQLRYRQTLIPVFTPDVLNGLRKQMDLAQQAIQGADPVYQQRMDFVRAGFDTGDLYFSAEHLMRSYAKTKDPNIRQQMVANMQRVIEICEDPRFGKGLIADGGYVLLDDIKKLHEQYRQGTTFAGEFAYFEDYYLGGRTFIDAVTKTGFVDDLYGLSLDGSNATGELVYYFDTATGTYESVLGKLVLTSPKSTVPLEVSARISDQDAWQPITVTGKGTTVDFDLTPIAAGQSHVWLSIRLKNPQSASAHVLHQLHLTGSVAK